MDRAAVARSLWDRIVARTKAVDDWHAQTPCPGWDVKDLVGHLGGIQRFFDTGGEKPQPPADWTPPSGLHPRDQWAEAAVAARRSWTVEEVLDELQVAADGHVERLLRTPDWDARVVGPVGETTEQGLFAVRVFDLWVHLQDLALALGMAVDAPDESAEGEIAQRYVLDRVPWLFGKQLGAPEGAVLRVRLGAPLHHDAALAVTEGRARWDGRAAEAGEDRETVVEADPAAFTLLVCGRGSAARWRDDGLLRWSGDRGAAFVERARLFR